MKKKKKYKKKKKRRYNSPSTKKKKADVYFTSYHPMKLIFQKSDNSSSLPYFKQSDPTMESYENILKRNTLKKNRNILFKLNEFIDKYYTISNKGSISKAEYIRMNIMISSVLLEKEDIDEEKMKKIALKDWENDSKNSDYMERDELINALFELVDLWTETIQESEYLIFIESLNIKLKYPKAYDNNAYSILL